MSAISSQKLTSVNPAVAREGRPQRLLSLVPSRGWNFRLGGGHVIGPNDDLLAVLPLDRDGFMGGLVSALIDREVAKNRFGLECQQGFPQLFRVKTARPADGVHQKLATGICPR